MLSSNTASICFFEYLSGNLFSCSSSFSPYFSSNLLYTHLHSLRDKLPFTLSQPSMNARFPGGSPHADTLKVTEVMSMIFNMFMYAAFDFMMRPRFYFLAAKAASINTITSVNSAEITFPRLGKRITGHTSPRPRLYVKGSYSSPQNKAYKTAIAR